MNPLISNTGRTPQAALRLRVAGICLALAAITLAVFGQTVRHQFVNFDDGDYVVTNPVVAHGLSFNGFIWAFARPHHANWHPLTWLSHMLDCQLYGLHPGGHHLTNVLLHTGTAIALFLVLRRMTGAEWRSAFVAAVFAIHPLRAESVAWVSERKDVLSGLFFMLTLWAYVRYAEKSGGSNQWSVTSHQASTTPAAGNGPRTTDRGTLITDHRSLFYLLSLLFFALGLMSKPMLVTLPAVLLLLDFWPLGRFRSLESGVQSLISNVHSPQSPAHTARKSQIVYRILPEKLPFLALSATSCVVTLLAQSKAMKPFETFPLPTRLGTALLSCKVYLVQMIYPARLAAFYPFPPHTSAWQVTMASILLLVLSAIAWGERRRRPWLLMGWLWYLVMLLPVLGLVQVGDQAHADRYTYLPQIGIYVAITWLAADFAAERQVGWMALGGLMASVLAVLMACAWKQTAYWNNSEALWKHALACTSGNKLAFVNLGHELYEQGRLDEAISHYRKGLEAHPNDRQFHNNLANALREKGLLDEAIVHYEKAVEIAPRSAEAQFNLGKALGLKGKPDEAIPRYEIAVQLEPDFLPAQLSLANALLQQGQADLAVPHFQKVLEARPNDAGLHLNLGLCFFQMGRMQEAKEEYEKALAIAPANPGIQNNLAWLLATCPAASLRDGDKAVELARQANALTGGEKPLILRTLAAALAQAGRFPEAVETAQHASALAEAQSIPGLARQIQSESNLYHAGKPVPLPGPTPDK
jgi:tetratricopeptide (TPR) repeat protein